VSVSYNYPVEQLTIILYETDISSSTPLDD